MAGRPEGGAIIVPSPLTQDQLDAELAAAGYLADDTLVTALYLALELGKPLLLEGVPGVGKTEVANRLAGILGRQCIRLQCYEGIDAGKALYDWDHARQLLQVRVAERGGSIDTSELYAPEFLIEMPLLKALRNAGTSILLIDEIDRADDAFEAFLLEFLSDFQISIPEIGTVKASQPVVTILTSNRTRELHDALRRRCLYHWIDYPGTGPRTRHHRAACAGHRGRSRRASDRCRRGRPSPAADQEAGHRREHRLGARRRRAAPRRRLMARRAEAVARPAGQGPGGFCRDRGSGGAMSSARPIGVATDLLADFPAALREAGLAIDPGRTEAFLRATATCRLRGVHDLARLGRVTLTGSPDDFPIFDAVFDSIFGEATFDGKVDDPEDEQAPRSAHQQPGGAVADGRGRCGGSGGGRRPSAQPQEL